MATCRNGRVSNAVEFVHSSSSKRNYSRDDKSMDMYDVYDYDDPEDFYYETIAIINQHHGIFEEKPHSIFSYYVHLVDMFDTHTTALYENIIKNEEVYQKVIEYIKNNPLKWEEDRYNNRK